MASKICVICKEPRLQGKAIYRCSSQQCGTYFHVKCRGPKNKNSCPKCSSIGALATSRGVSGKYSTTSDRKISPISVPISKSDKRPQAALSAEAGKFKFESSTHATKLPVGVNAENLTPRTKSNEGSPFTFSGSVRLDAQRNYNLSPCEPSSFESNTSQSPLTPATRRILSNIEFSLPPNATMTSSLVRYVNNMLKTVEEAISSSGAAIETRLRGPTDSLEFLPGLSQRIGELSSRVESMEALLADRDACISRLQGDIDRLNARNVEMSSKICELESSDGFNGVKEAINVVSSKIDSIVKVSVNSSPCDDVPQLLSSVECVANQHFNALAGPPITDF